MKEFSRGSSGKKHRHRAYAGLCRANGAGEVFNPGPYFTQRILPGDWTAETKLQP